MESAAPFACMNSCCSSVELQNASLQTPQTTCSQNNAEDSLIDLLNKGIIAEDGTVLFAFDHTQMLEFLNQLAQQGTENTYALAVQQQRSECL